MPATKMAVFLNKPDDFTTTEKPPASSVRSMDKVELLPPSAFETTSGATADIEGPWKALGNATTQILELRKELEELRKQKQQVSVPVGEEIRARVDVHHAPQKDAPVHATQDVSHYSDLINRQASEIADLKKTLASSERSHQMELAKFESQILVRDAQSDQKREGLAIELERCKKNHSQELQNVITNYQKTVNDQTERIEELQHELERKIHSHRAESSDLHRALDAAEARVKKLEEDLNNEKSNKDQLLENQSKQINQLKKYISETEEGSRSSEVWRRDLESMRLKVKRLERDKEELLSANNLLNVRINSLDKILTLQEQAMSKHNPSDLDKNRNCLLTRWREKVYQLMVQLKSTEICQKKSEQSWTLAFSEMVDRLQSCEAECEMLRHSLENKEAELTMMANKVKICEEEVSQAQDVALRIDENLQKDKETGQVLASFAHNAYDQYQKLEDLVSGVMTSLNGYNHRISFATGRIQLLESQLVRKSAISKLKSEDAPEELPTRDKEPEVQDENLVKQLNWELDQVTKERDRLASIIKQDSQLLEQKIGAAKQLYADEVLELKERLKELHEELEEKTKVIESLSMYKNAKEKELGNAKELIDELTTAVDNKESELKKELSEHLRKESEAHDERVRDLEEKLNAAKREQAKAVVALTQAERQHEREKKKSAERFEVVESQLRTEVERLEEKVRSAQAERNLLMTTIRQEGLLSKVKSQREAPTVPGYIDEEPTKDSDNGVSLKVTDFAMTDEPLHSVIDDLRSLTAVVMEDNSSLEDE